MLFSLSSFRSKRLVSLVVFLVVAAGSLWPGMGRAQAEPEMRGMWVTRFEWPDRGGDAEKMRTRISEIMTTLARNNFNAVYFQIRGQADVLYPSPFEPWSTLIGGADPGFDPLEFAIAEAHRNNLEFHAYLNPFPSWQDKEAPPEDPEHPYNRFPDWRAVFEDGRPVYAEYFYFSPGNPEVHTWLRMIVRDLVERYDVDGIHLDRIRYPDAKASHDKISRERFAGRGNPRKLGWEDWQREQITRFLYALYGEIQLLKPKVKLTAAVWGIYDNTRIDGYSGFSSGYHQYYQDSFAWMQVKAMDALVPMIYWPIGGKPPHYDELYEDFFKSGSHGRHIYGGTAARHQPEQIKSALQFTRQINGHGTVAFSHSSAERANNWPVYRQLYKAPAPVPPMPWKDDAKTGHIVGRVLDADGAPVTDAWVRLEGLQSVWLSSADGFFAVLHLAPGKHLVSGAHDDGPAASRTVEVTGGKTVKLELRLE